MTAKLWAHFLAWLTKGSQEDAEEYEKKINEKMKEYDTKRINKRNYK